MNLGAGMPYPQNLRAAEAAEGVIRQNGATPATIAVIDGVPCIGMLYWLVFRLLLCAFAHYPCDETFMSRLFYAVPWQDWTHSS